MALLNHLMRLVFRGRMQRIRRFSANPHEAQAALLKKFLDKNRATEIGKRNDFRSIRSPQTFADRVPIVDYEGLKPDINRMMHGERDVLWAGAVNWFAKSSGTSNDRSKFIPVTLENLRNCHLRGAWDTTTLIYDQQPNARFFDGKMLIMGGSYEIFPQFPQTRVGDVSAIMISNLPPVGNYIYTPSPKIALQSNTESKIEAMAQQLIHEDLRMLGGVPTWTVVLLRRILEITKKKNILEVFPNLKGYIHGGVSFAPYRTQFEALIPDENFLYWEIYNASEGYFAAQNELNARDMLLLLDNGIYFEFLPERAWHSSQPQAVPLEGVRVGENYALVITTNAGLWRYTPGDTVYFTSTNPYKIQVSGRTNQFVNAFGEELMVSNTDSALAEACKTTGALVADYTVAPIYFSLNEKGGHEWLVEFEKEPENIEQFNNILDHNLQRVNSDYEAKRFKSMAMERLRLRALPRGTFNNWLRMKGKFGGQSKVPRLANDRRYVDEILKLLD